MSNKSSKGTPFEKDVAYSLIQAGCDVIWLGDNSKSLDIIAKRDGKTYYIECKFHKSFTWNKAEKFFRKLIKSNIKDPEEFVPLLIYKSNLQPVLVMRDEREGLTVTKFESYFGSKYEKRPKGWKIWKT